MTEENRELKIGAYLAVPKRLVELSRQASKITEAFYVLGGFEGRDAFLNSFLKHLKAQNWPMGPDPVDSTSPVPYVSREMSGFLVDHVCNYLGVFDNGYIEVLRGLVEALQYYPAEVRDFICDRKNYAILENALKAAAEETKKVYGDPAIVKQYGEMRLTLKAAFDAVKAKVTPETPETKLCKAFEKAFGIAEHYEASKGIPVRWFVPCWRGYLEQKWNLRNAEETERLCVFDTLVSRARFDNKTTIPVRVVLMDDTFPAKKQWRVAKDFMLAHADDIVAAAEAVAKDIDDARVSPESAQRRSLQWGSESDLKPWRLN